MVFNTVFGIILYDIVNTENNVDEINKSKTYLKSKFLITDLGKLKYFLSIEVSNNTDGVCLSQRKYCLDILVDYGMTGCKPVSTSMEQNLCVACEPSASDKHVANINEYQKLVGRLMYLTLTRHDISFAVHVFSQYMHSPLQSHSDLAFRVLRYLKGAPGKGIQIVKGNDFNLNAYCDSDSGKCKLNRKSVTGYLVFFCNSLTSWKSKEKQATISRSSAKAEYRAMGTAASEIVWIKNLLLGIHIELPVKLHCHNTSAIQIAANPVYHERTKHFEIDMHFIREKVSSGLIKTVKVDSSNQLEDILIKGSGSYQHNVLSNALGLKDFSRGGLSLLTRGRKPVRCNSAHRVAEAVGERGFTAHVLGDERVSGLVP
ncbi:uncharacterized mitochondrial protein AtMg00810-like [Rutidosis leptorrhynchoides]|uniref:uncharacterized mitochondrial protein AtMg00810-like n=1 Tax=Rutidosis leptorrhynchoides TaxID=125765 RepID=UPI003A9975B9